jgi:hypothetical protein
MVGPLGVTHAGQVPPPSQRLSGPTCVACLGNRQCWVCLGQGRSEQPDGGFAACHRCAGTGVCSSCAPPAAIDVRTPELPPRAVGAVLRLDGESPLRVEASVSAPSISVT